MLQLKPDDMLIKLRAAPQLLHVCVYPCVCVLCGPKFRPCGRGSGRATHASSAACSRNKQLEPITEEFAASASASRRDGKVGGGGWSEGGAETATAAATATATAKVALADQWSR